MSPRTLLFTVTAIVGIALDQLTKAWVTASLELGGRDEIVLIENFLSIIHVRNTGAAFSMMEGQMSLFMIFTVVFAVIVIDFARRLPETARVESVLLGMVFGGMIGNFLDRVRQGEVVDMIKVFWGWEPGRSALIEQFGTYVYPIWNVADALLVVGLLAFVAYYLMQGDSEPQLDDLDEEEGVPSGP
ncbi:MAG: signal peptidase II [Myxococcota bacterium]